MASMKSAPFSFDLHHIDAHCAARRGTFHTPHGPVELPTFMPVGTLGTVKGLEIRHVRDTGTQMLLANAYHLALRPGEEVVQSLGGLHRFTGWDGPILTDSGGFQLFSLAHRAVVTEEKVTFRSHIDGRLLEISPERAVRIQEALGSDVAMVLDQVVPLPSEPDVVRQAAERTVRWAKRCRQAASRDDQALFAIVQGGLDPALRVACARQLSELDFAGYAVGGLSVGEEPAEMIRILQAITPELPAEKPRYLMGVGRPEDLLGAVRLGIDLFDCVMPTRNGRNAMAFADEGTLRLRNLRYERDDNPIQRGCPCPACRRCRGYIRHLFMAGEMLGPILLSIHNLTYYQRLLCDARRAIEADRFEAFRAEKLQGWAKKGDRRIYW